MSALGQQQTSKRVQSMSALPPKADIGTQSWNVRFVPKADFLRCGKSVVIPDRHMKSRGIKLSQLR